MPTVPLRRVERDPNRINEAIRSLQEGRSNAHGTFSLTDDNATTSTVVDALTCSDESCVSITPTNANAANHQRNNDVYVVAGNKSFTVYHGATALSCTFAYSVQG